MIWLSTFYLLYILQPSPPDIGQIQQDLLYEETLKIEHQLDEIDLALEVLEVEEITDEQLLALHSFGEDSRIHIAQVAAEIRRKFDDDPEYVQSKELRSKIRVLDYRLERAQTKLRIAIQNVRQNLRNHDLDHEVLAQMYSHLAILDLRCGLDFAEALQDFQLWVGSLASLSETQLRNILDSYHSFYSASLYLHHEREKKVTFLLSLLDEYQAEALDEALHQWLLQPSRQLQQVQHELENETLEGRLRSALSTEKDLREIIAQEVEALKQAKKDIQKSIEDSSKLAADLAQQNPQVIYDILIKDLAIDEE